MTGMYDKLVVKLTAAPILALCVLVSARAANSSIAPADSQTPDLVQLFVPGGTLQAFVAPAHGADLAGLQIQRNGQWNELLYRGMDYQPTSGWTGKAPILWPAVGRNFAQNERLGWVLHGTEYPLAIHGFARDERWEIQDRGMCEHSAFVTLVLHDSERTRRLYPFGFTFTTEYRVWKNTLYIRQFVQADRSNAEAMPFSIGNHITFRIPLLSGSDPGKTLLTTPATQQVITDSSGRPTGRIVSVSYAKPRLLSSFEPLKPISLSGYAESQTWVRIADPSGFSVAVLHSEDRRPEGVPVLFNLWGDVANGYFAPEPWVGKQNSLVTRDGVVALMPGDAFNWTIEVQVDSQTNVQAVQSTHSAAPTCEE